MSKWIEFGDYFINVENVFSIEIVETTRSTFSLRLYDQSRGDYRYIEFSTKSEAIARRDEIIAQTESKEVVSCPTCLDRVSVLEQNVSALIQGSCSRFMNQDSGMLNKQNVDKNPIHDFKWAIDRLLEGKKVARSWNNRIIYLSFKDNVLMFTSYGEDRLPFLYKSDCEATDYVVVE